MRRRIIEFCRSLFLSLITRGGGGVGDEGDEGDEGGGIKHRGPGRCFHSRINNWFIHPSKVMRSRINPTLGKSPKISVANGNRREQIPYCLLHNYSIIILRVQCLSLKQSKFYFAISFALDIYLRGIISS